MIDPRISHSDEGSSPDTPRSGPGVMARVPTVAALVVLITGLSVTFLIARYESANIDRRDQSHFDRLAERMQNEVERRLGVYRHALMGTRSVFAASNYVDRDEFIKLVESRDLASELPAAMGLGYIESVPAEPDAFQAFVDKVRDEGATWFEVTVPPGAGPMPGSVMDSRHIIKYIEPLDNNRSAHGLDIGSHPVRREASERAVVTGEASLTGIIQLVQDDQRVAGSSTCCRSTTPRCRPTPLKSASPRPRAGSTCRCSGPVRLRASPR